MNKKRILSVFLLLAVVFSLCPAYAAADGTADPTVTVIYFEDGSYLTTEVTTYDTAVSRAANTTSGRKRATYSSASGSTLFTFTVYGNFTYDGTTATATQAAYGHIIDDSTWSLESATAYCSGNQAIAEGTFIGGLLLTRNAIVTLTCSPDGVLS